MALNNLILFCHVMHEKHVDLTSGNRYSYNTGMSLLHSPFHTELTNTVQFQCSCEDSLAGSIWSLLSQSVKYKRITSLYAPCLLLRPSPSIAALSRHQLRATRSSSACQKSAAGVSVRFCFCSLLSMSCFSSYCLYPLQVVLILGLLGTAFVSQINSCFLALLILVPISH